MIDLPSLYEFRVSRNFTSFFRKKMKYYKESNFLIDRGSTATINGDQTLNLLDLKDKDVNEKLFYLKKRLERKCGVKFEFYWVHMIEYESSGSQNGHKHDHNEDYSVIVYLNSCRDGATYFVLNEKRNVRTKVLPERGRGVMFHAGIKHGAYPTNDGKHILVLGLKML